MFWLTLLAIAFHRELWQWGWSFFASNAVLTYDTLRVNPTWWLSVQALMRLEGKGA
jgi:hypothetical protein